MDAAWDYGKKFDLKAPYSYDKTTQKVIFNRCA